MSENTTHESPAYEKRGYLNHEFRLFHLRGQMDTPVAYHYHDFHKVLILLNGEADYIVEGRSYHLRPLDIVLVGAHCLHKPVVPYRSRYERIILYLSPECLDAFSCADCALDLCFQLAREQQSDVLRLGSLTMTPLLEALSRLENAYQAGGTNDNGTDNAIDHRLFIIRPIGSGSISAGNIHTEVHVFIRVLRDTFGSIIRTRNQSHGQKYHQLTYQNFFHAILSFYQLTYILLSIAATFHPLTRTCITGFT